MHARSIWRRLPSRSTRIETTANDTKFHRAALTDRPAETALGPCSSWFPADHCWCRRRKGCFVLGRTAPDGSRVQTEILTSDERSPNLPPPPLPSPLTPIAHLVGNVRDCSAPSPDCYSDNWYIPASAAPDGRPISCIRSFRRLNRSRAHDHHEAHTPFDHCPERSLLAARIYETEEPIRIVWHSRVGWQGSV